MNGYLIPANSKKSMLILGLFTTVDLIIFLVGCFITIVMLMLFKSNNLGQMLLILAPALVATFLVAPIPNYHNVLQLLTNIITFYLNQRKYRWKGWCMYDESDN
ncbi:MAG: hypothetical protein E7158_03335 [Firmicutes bacterium]|nr:hypothetical protein [Bacillota bacterium]